MDGRPVGTQRSACGVLGGLRVSLQSPVMQLKTFGNYPLQSVVLSQSFFFFLLLALAKCLHLEQCFKIDRKAEIVCYYVFIGRFLYTDPLYGGSLDQAQEKSALVIFIFKHANTLHSYCFTRYLLLKTVVVSVLPCFLSVQTWYLQ